MKPLAFTDFEPVGGGRTGRQRENKRLRENETERQREIQIERLMKI